MKNNNLLLLFYYFWKIGVQNTNRENEELILIFLEFEISMENFEEAVENQNDLK